MSPTIDDSICTTCPHQVIAGVACDWRPADECPFMMSQKGNTKIAQGSQVPFAIASETDAVRSID